MYTVVFKQAYKQAVWWAVCICRCTVIRKTCAAWLAGWLHVQLPSPPPQGRSINQYMNQLVTKICLWGSTGQFTHNEKIADDDTRHMLNTQDWKIR